MDAPTRQPDDELEPLTECDEPKSHGPITRGFKYGLLIGACVAVAASVPLAARLYDVPPDTAGSREGDITYSVKFFFIFAVIVLVGGCASAVSAAMVQARADPRPWWHRWLPRFSLRGVIIFQAVIAVLLGVPYSWPKSEQLQYLVTPNDDHIGYYRGLGWIEEPGFFGKNFYRLRILTGGGDPIEYVNVDVFIDEKDSCPFRAHYPDGTLRLQGVGSVEFTGYGGNEPVPNIDYPRAGNYYRPDGTLGSEIVDGTGVATIWNVDGAKMSEWRIEDYEFVSWTQYDVDGNATKHITP